MPAQHSPFAFSLTLGCCLLAACQRLPHNVGMMEREVANAKVSSYQLRVLVNEFAIFSAHRVELTADSILAATSDPMIRRNALLWKINGISASFQAAARSDPLGAYLDTWILNRQLIQLAESTIGSTLFGPWQAEVVEEYYAFNYRLKQINQTVGVDLLVGNVIVGEEFVAKFANDYPLNSLYFDREPLASRYLDQVQAPSREMLQVVANVAEDVDELKKLSMLYAEHLPKQARWEAELLLLDTMQLAVVQRPLQDFSKVSEAVSAMAGTVQMLPEIVDNEQRALESMVSQERQETLLELERMRGDTVAALSSERAIVIDAIQQERIAVLDTLREERLAVTQQLNSEFSRALQATDDITRRRTEEIVRQTPLLIDHFFKRTWQTCAILCLALVVLALLHIRARSVNLLPIRRLTHSAVEEKTDITIHVPHEGKQAA